MHLRVIRIASGINRVAPAPAATSATHGEVPPAEISEAVSLSKITLVPTHLLAYDSNRCVESLIYEVAPALTATRTAPG